MQETVSDAKVFDLFQPVPSVASGIHIYDYVGAATRIAYKRGWDKHAITRGSEFKPRVPPKNEHYLDWVALLTAVARAEGVFRMAELGAGWAPWTVRAALAAKQRQQIQSLELCAIEADPQHFEWMTEHFQDNGLEPAHYHLLHGAASGSSDLLRFPVIEDPDVDYGASLNRARSSTETIEVQGYTILDLLAFFSGPLDFLHIDIQGAEYDALPPTMDQLYKTVKCIMIGTHISDSSHDNLSQSFRDAGWREMFNFPRNTTSLTPWGEIKLNDGFLLYENPNFI
jgi:FkbM family methyltransferase